MTEDAKSNNLQRYIVYLLIAALVVLGIYLISVQLNEDSQASAEVKTYTIGVVTVSPQLEPIYQSFRARMTEMGYVEGENVTYIYNGAVAPDMLEAEVQALLDQDVDLILSMSTPATQAAKKVQDAAGTSIPVVFVPVTDPVSAGIVEDLNAPGGNITGITFGAADGPRLNWLLTLDPDIETVYVPYRSNDNSATRALETVQQAADELGIELETLALEDEADLEDAITDIPANVDAIFLMPDSFVMSRIPDWIEQAQAEKLPLSVASDQDVANGALVSYSFSLPAAGVQAARLAQQILEGSDPGTLPVEMAELYLVINTETAEEIDLELPDTILAQADTLIRE